MPRPKTPDPLVRRTVLLPASMWEWLDLWLPSGNYSERLREVLDRAMRFWPCGPSSNASRYRRKKDDAE